MVFEYKHDMLAAKSDLIRGRFDMVVVPNMNILMHPPFLNPYYNQCNFPMVDRVAIPVRVLQCSHAARWSFRAPPAHALMQCIHFVSNTVTLRHSKCAMYTILTSRHIHTLIYVNIHV